MVDANLSLKIREVDFPDIKDAWQELEQSGDLPTIFQCYGWIEPWWRHLGHGKKILLAAYEGDLLVGIAPMFIERMTLKGIPFFNIMRFMGTPESDYHAFILRQGYQEKALLALLKALKHYNWDIAWLSDVKSDTSTADLLTKGLKAEGLHFMERQHTPCPYITLPSDYESYKGSLSKNSRRNITKYCNRFEKNAGAGFRKIQKMEDISPAIDTFITLHGQWWRDRGQSGALNSEALRAYHREAANTLSAYLDLKQLVVDDKVVGTVYSYDFQGRRCVYLPGIDPAWSDHSLGYVMMAYNIQDAINKGLREFDFMRGDEEYKFHFTGSVRHNRVYYFSRSKIKIEIFRQIERL